MPFSLISRLRAELDQHENLGNSTPGTEVGGVLLGHQTTLTTLDIDDFVWVSSEEQPGGRYTLDPSALERLRSVYTADDENAGRQSAAVGYFRTQSDHNLRLRAEEIGFVEKYFRDPTNVVLLIQTSLQPYTAGFLFRMKEGAFAPFSILDFPLNAELLRLRAQSGSTRARVTAPTEERETLPLRVITDQPEYIGATVTETVSEPVLAPVETSSPPTLPVRRIQSDWVSAVRLVPKPRWNWRLVASLALLGIAVIVLGVWAWQNLFLDTPLQQLAATSSSSRSSVSIPAATSPSQLSPPAQSSDTDTPAPAPVGAHVNLEASELTWVTLRDAGGNQLLARLFAAGDTQSFDLPNGATLHVGNAGGLNILLNGNSIGSIGPHGKVREVLFSNSTFKVTMD